VQFIIVVVETNQALAKALMVGGAVTLGVWSVLFYMVPILSEEWPSGICFVLFSLLIVVPALFLGFRRQGKPVRHNRRLSVFTMTCSFIASAGYAIAFCFEHKRGWESMSNIATSAFWLIFAIENLRRIRKARSFDKSV
jgi:uncharacterized membrane protein YhaH (DUF805 family)